MYHALYGLVPAAHAKHAKLFEHIARGMACVQSSCFSTMYSYALQLTGSCHVLGGGALQ